MITFDVRADFSGGFRQLEAIGKQADVAASKAINATARDVRHATRAEMSRVFDRPTPWTLNSIYVKEAKPARLVATVWIKDEAAKGTPAATYLKPQIEGGRRDRKRFEESLRLAGVLPGNMLAMPGVGAAINQYGNMRPQQIVQILSQLRIQRAGGYESRIGGERWNRKKVARAIKKQGMRIFALPQPRQNLPAGVFGALPGRKVKPLLVFVGGAGYKARYHFTKVAERTVKEKFPGHFAAALEYVLRTAR